MADSNSSVASWLGVVIGVILPSMKHLLPDNSLWCKYSDNNTVLPVLRGPTMTLILSGTALKWSSRYCSSALRLNREHPLLRLLLMLLALLLLMLLALLMLLLLAQSLLACFADNTCKSKLSTESPLSSDARGAVTSRREETLP